MNDPKTLKLYIAVLDEVPDHMVPVLVAHAVLSAHRQFAPPHFANTAFDNYHWWLNESFKKVVLRVNQKEFDKITELSNVYLGYESSTLEGKDSCAVVCPRYDLPNVLKFAKMWTPAHKTEDYERNESEGLARMGTTKFYDDDELQ